MKRKITLVVLMVVFSVNVFSQAPNWAWARSGGSVSNDYSNGTSTDANGNVYVVGTFQGTTITFGSYTLQNSATGRLDIFIVKYDAGGNVLWAKSAGGADDDYAFGICVDVSGGVYVTGSFRSDTISFGTFTLTNVAAFYRDIFLAKYDSSGNELWARSGNGPSDDLSWGGICSDANNNVYITGSYGYNSIIIFGSDTLISRGNYEIFIVKYDPAGNVLWTKSNGGAQSDGGISICSDANNNIYVTGYFSHDAIFENDTVIGNNYATVFVVKYDSNGNKVWVKCARGAWVASSGIGYDVNADAYGNVYVTGLFQYDVSFGDTLGNAGNYSVFLAKYDSSGNALWGRTPGGTVSDNGNSVCTDANGNVFFTGYFTSPFLNFGGFPVINANAGYNDIFVAEYDANGNALWATGIGGQGNDFGMGICSNLGNDIYVAGYFSSYSLNFGSTTITNNGSNDFFLAKLSTLVGIDEPISSGSDIFIFPNPATNQLTIESRSFGREMGIESVEVWDVVGERIKDLTLTLSKGEGTASIDVSGLARGIYFVGVRPEASGGRNGLVVRKVVKM